MSQCKCNDKRETKKSWLGNHGLDETKNTKKSIKKKCKSDCGPDCKCKKDLHNFISYFQSVTTIGVISLAKNQKEAEADAKKRMQQSDFAHGIVGQTPMTFSMTEKWEG